MTKDEFVYLYNTRETSSGQLYAKAQVNGINGVILLPDNWNVSIYNLNNTNNNIVSYSVNTISESIWLNTFQVNGAVFFPASGNRYGTYVDRVGTYGTYWLATITDQIVYLIYLSDSNFRLGTDGRERGYSVRLVQDYNDK